MVPAPTKKSDANQKKAPVKKDNQVVPINPAKYKEAVNLGKELSKNPESTKADVARAMFDLISEEKREAIAQAFVEGANLTPKGAMTYVYNIRRKKKKDAAKKE